MSGPVNGVCVSQVTTLTPENPPGAVLPELPEPTQSFTTGTADDAMSALYTAISEQQQDQLCSGEAEVRANTDAQQQALSNQRAALQRAEHDRPSGFWNDLEKVALDVAKVAAIVASVAATVATAGAGAPILVATALALSIGGAVISETHCFGSASTWIGLGAELGGAVLGFGASFVATGVASAGAQLLAKAGGGALVVAGCADATAGGAQVVIGIKEHDVQLDDADATQAQNEADRAQRLTTWVLDQLQQNQKDTEGALQTLEGAWRTHDETQLAIASTPIRG
jgi:hypothetical protein